MLRFCGGVNGLNHSSPWSASGQSLTPSQKSSHPHLLTYSTLQRLMPIGNLYALSSSCQSWFTFSGVMEWVLKVCLWKAVFSHLILSSTTFVTISYPSAHFTLLTCSLINPVDPIALCFTIAPRGAHQFKVLKHLNKVLLCVCTLTLRSIFYFPGGTFQALSAGDGCGFLYGSVRLSRDNWPGHVFPTYKISNFSHICCQRHDLQNHCEKQ